MPGTPSRFGADDAAARVWSIGAPFDVLGRELMAIGAVRSVAVMVAGVDKLIGHILLRRPIGQVG